MRKLFLLIPALVLSLAISANVIYINTETSDALRKALYNAADGDIIEMAAGTYVESNSNYIAFDGKHVTVRAAEGAEVLIQPQVPITISNGGCAHFENVKIDASRLTELADWYEHVIYPTDANENNSMILEGCEIYGFTLNKSLLFCGSAYRLASVTINNCYFHNIMKSCLFIESTAAIGISISNSTFANIETASGYDAGVIDTRATSGSFSVDHCTFYNVQAKNTDYAAIGKVKLASGATVTNCIFAFSESASSNYRTIRDKVTATNCLVYNYTADSGYGMQSNVTKNNCFIADPLFTDAANGDYSFAGNWVTMELSPARGAATDGSDLGDPRWYSAEVLPSTDFAGGYQFVGAKAQIAGNIWYDGENGYLYYNDKSECGVATWKINATRACVLAATLNMNAATTTGHKFKVEVLDANGNSVGETAEPSQKSDAGNIALPDQIVLPAAGNYTVKLYNLQGWSSAKIDGVTFSYVGGAVQAMPATTDIDDAWFSAQGTRADGKIDFPDGYIQDGWVKWNVSFAETANYNVTVNIDNANGHNYTVALYTSETDENPIFVTEGAQKGTIGTLDLGALEVPAGNYIMKVTNATQYSDAKLISVNFSYAGGAAVELSKTTPANLLANADAIVSDDWSIEGGKIVHPESKALTGWAKWNVNSADYGNYNVTVNISSDNGHLVRVEIFEDENAAPIYTLDETSATKYHTGDQAIDLGNIVLDNREYVVKVSNTGEYSHVQIASIVISYLNGARATLPASCTFADLMLSEKAHVTEGNLWFNTIGDSNPVGQWAKWNVKVAEAGTFLFTMNVSSSNGQSYKISILDMNEDELDAFESGSLGAGDKVAKGYFNLAAGNYIVMLENATSWSQGHVVSLAVTQPELLTIDEAAETNAVIHDNYRNGTHDIQVIRSIVPNMYNTICLPFDVATAQLQAIFGSDVELKQMASATLSGDVLDLEFEAASSIYRGTPYLIKTTKAVANPVFTAVEIKEEVGQATSGDAVDFIGNFIAGEVPAGENNLFLGPNDLLYFSQDATPIKGMRAYFHVKGAAAAAKRARIIMKENGATAIDLVNDEHKAIKRIENGQVVILRDGIRYNVMGTKLQ